MLRYLVLVMACLVVAVLIAQQPVAGAEPLHAGGLAAACEIHPCDGAAAHRGCPSPELPCGGSGCVAYSCILSLTAPRGLPLAAPPALPRSYDLALPVALLRGDGLLRPPKA